MGNQHENALLEMGGGEMIKFRLAKYLAEFLMLVLLYVIVVTIILFSERKNKK